MGSGGLARLKPWRHPAVCQIPTTGPFRAVDIGLPNTEVIRLSSEGFIEPAGRAGNATIWRATGRLRRAVDTPVTKADHMAESGKRLAEFIRQNPGRSTRFYARLMGEEKSVIGYRIKLLEADGIVRVEKPENWHRGIPFQVYLRSE